MIDACSKEGEQGRRKVWKTGGASCNVVCIICLLVEIGLTDLPKSRGSPIPPAPTGLGSQKKAPWWIMFWKNKRKKKRIEGGEQKKNIYTIQCHVFAKLSKTLPRRKRIIDFDFANFRFGTIQQDLFQRSEWLLTDWLTRGRRKETRGRSCRIV